MEGDIALDGKDVGQIAVVRLGPEMPVRLGVNQLGHDAHAVPRAPDASL
jgi:hypothetical protein